MKKFKIKLDKKLLNRVREDVNLILFNIKGFGIKEMQIVNNIARGLEGVKITISNN